MGRAAIGTLSSVRPANVTPGGQGDRKRRSLPDGAGDPHASAVLLDNGFDDRQTQSGAAIVGGHRRRAIEPFKNAGLRFRRNARPGVAHFQAHLIVVGAQRDGDSVRPAACI